MYGFLGSLRGRGGIKVGGKDVIGGGEYIGLGGGGVKAF